MEVTLATFDSAFVTDAGAENNSMELPQKTVWLYQQTIGLGSQKQINSTYLDAAKPSLERSLKNCIELLIDTGLLACDKHDLLTERFSITRFAAIAVFILKTSLTADELNCQIFKLVS